MPIDNPSTAGPETATSRRLKNALSSVLLISLACGAYAVAPFHLGLLRRLYGASGWSFSGHEFLAVAGSAYALAVVAWMMFEPQPGRSKSLRFFGVVARFASKPGETIRSGLEPADRVAVLATLLKAFFGPLMTLSLMSFCMNAIGNLNAMLISHQAGASAFTLFDRYGFWFALQVILFVDVLIFTVGYLVETPRLNNEIRSVDPTWLGWAAAMLCYPPFNTLSASVLGSMHEDFPRFADPLVHVVANSVLLALMAVYASASVALGWKASNLTHRGIIGRGPYAWVRHPAYTCKNMAWWIGSVPLVGAAFQQGFTSGVLALASVAGWTLLYVLRALTEEDHLRRVDGEYAVYAARVRRRFIPGVI